MKWLNSFGNFKFGFKYEPMLFFFKCSQKYVQNFTNKKLILLQVVLQEIINFSLEILFRIKFSQYI